jgi:acyl-CoA thioester hydrolase
MDARVPFSGYQSCVQPDWIDFNGHMNVAYYVLAFDQATDMFNSNLGLGPDYSRDTRRSVFVVAMNTTYKRQLKQDMLISCTTQLIEFESNKMRIYHQMFNADEGFLAATSELIMVHVDLETGRSCPFQPPALKSLQSMARQHQSLAIPDGVGRVLAL